MGTLKNYSSYKLLLTTPRLYPFGQGITRHVGHFEVFHAKHFQTLVQRFRPCLRESGADNFHHFCVSLCVSRVSDCVCMSPDIIKISVENMFVDLINLCVYVILFAVTIGPPCASRVCV